MRATSGALRLLLSVAPCPIENCAACERRAEEIDAFVAAAIKHERKRIRRSYRARAAQRKWLTAREIAL